MMCFSFCFVSCGCNTSASTVARTTEDEELYFLFSSFFLRFKLSIIRIKIKVRLEFVFPSTGIIFFYHYDNTVFKLFSGSNWSKLKHPLLKMSQISNKVK